MGIERDSKYYDMTFNQSAKWKVHFYNSPYYKVWDQLTGYINYDLDIIELGCGSGQLARYICSLFNNGNKYTAVDFSHNRIEWAKSNKYVILDNDGFISMVRRYSLDYDCIDFIEDDVFHFIENRELPVCNYIMTEFLEHIEDDIILLHKIPVGSKVVFTVPNFNDSAHVRYFSSNVDIYKRYNISLDILKIVNINIGNSIIFLCDSIKY
jgi:SAM-dependent methyltransferase